MEHSTRLIRLGSHLFSESSLHALIIEKKKNIAIYLLAVFLRVLPHSLIKICITQNVCSPYIDDKLVQ